MVVEYEDEEEEDDDHDDDDDDENGRNGSIIVTEWSQKTNYGHQHLRDFVEDVGLE